MDFPLSNSISRIFNLDMPHGETMDDYLDQIVPIVQPMSEDLYETDYYIGTRWLEIRDDENFHESVLHIFMPPNEYMQSTDGNILKGTWRLLPGNILVVESPGGRSELFTLAFMNNNFFILQKHGDQTRKGQKKYFVMANEEWAGGREWRDIMEALFNIYRNNWMYIAAVLVALVLLFAIAYYSFLK